MPNFTAAEGDVAAAGTDSGNPVKVGGYAKAAAPTAVTDGQRANAWFDLTGRLNVKIDTASLLAGDVASGSSDSGNPLKIGGFTSTTQPTAVTAGQRVAAWFDIYGRLVTIPEDATNPTTAVFTQTATGPTQSIAAPSGSNALYILSLLVTNSSATLSRVDFQDGSGGTTHVTGVAGASGGGFFWHPTRPWRLTNATALCVVLGTGVTDIRITIEYLSKL